MAPTEEAEFSWRRWRSIAFAHKTNVRLIPIFVLWTIASLPSDVRSSADRSAAAAGEPRVAARPFGAFEVELQPPDRFIAAQGVGPAIELWTRHVLAAKRDVVLVGSDFAGPWVKAIIQLRELRPEVRVVVIASRSALGSRGEVAESLAAAGISVSFSTSLASMAGFPTIPQIRGLLLVRDQQSVVLVSGASNQEGLVNAWLIESTPIAEAYSERVAELRRQLPSYPEAKEILLSDQ